MTEQNPPMGQEPQGEHPHTPADDREVIYFEGSPLLARKRGDSFC